MQSLRCRILNQPANRRCGELAAAARAVSIFVHASMSLAGFPFLEALNEREACGLVQNLLTLGLLEQSGMAELGEDDDLVRQPITRVISSSLDSFRDFDSKP